MLPLLHVVVNRPVDRPAELATTRPHCAPSGALPTHGTSSPDKVAVFAYGRSVVPSGPRYRYMTSDLFGLDVLVLHGARAYAVWTMGGKDGRQLATRRR